MAVLLGGMFVGIILSLGTEKQRRGTLSRLKIEFPAN
jgi:hypothetical protein